MIRRVLHQLHRAGAVAAGALLIAVGLLTLVPIGARLFGLPAHSWDEVATFCMAGSAFLGLASTWRAGVHVRMELLVSRIPGLAGRWLQTAALAVTLAACVYFAWYATRFAWLSYSMNDVSQGLLPIPLWIPQSAMVVGLWLICAAIAESLFDALRGGPTAPGNADTVLARAASEL